MNQRRISPFVPLGFLIFVAGMLLHHFRHGRYWDFAGGVLMGMAVVFLIFGLVRTMKSKTE